MITRVVEEGEDLRMPEHAIDFIRQARSLHNGGPAHVDLCYHALRVQYRHSFTYKDEKTKTVH